MGDMRKKEKRVKEQGKTKVKWQMDAKGCEI
jgi:hypothetical protein